MRRGYTSTIFYLDDIILWSVFYLKEATSTKAARRTTCGRLYMFKASHDVKPGGLSVASSWLIGQWQQDLRPKAKALYEIYAQDFLEAIAVQSPS